MFYGISKKCNVFPSWLRVMDDRMTVMIWKKHCAKKKDPNKRVINNK